MWTKSCEGSRAPKDAAGMKTNPAHRAASSLVYFLADSPHERAVNK